MNWLSKFVVGAALMVAANGALAQQQSGIAVDVKGPGVTIDGVAAEEGTRINVQPGTRIVANGGEVMVNHIKCRVRVRPGARYTVMDNADACKLAGITREEPKHGFANVKWWPYAAFGAVALAAVIGNGSDSEDIASSP